MGSSLPGDCPLPGVPGHTPQSLHLCGCSPRQPSSAMPAFLPLVQKPQTQPVLGAHLDGPGWTCFLRKGSRAPAPPGPTCWGGSEPAGIIWGNLVSAEAGDPFPPCLEQKHRGGATRHCLHVVRSSLKATLLHTKLGSGRVPSENTARLPAHTASGQPPPQVLTLSISSASGEWPWRSEPAAWLGIARTVKAGGEGI